MKKCYINGYEDNTFRPDDSMTRAEFVKLVNKVFGFTQEGTEDFTDVNKDENLDKLNSFKDEDKTSQWAQSSVEGAIAARYLNGYEDKTIRANSNITRAEAVSMLSRVKK